MNEQTPRLLIVEDDKGLRRQLRWAFEGYDVTEAGDRQSALQAVGSESLPVVLLDLGLPPDADGPSEGIATLEGILSLAPHTKVIMMTGQGSRDYAVKAVAAGAYDFYQKPVDIDVLSLIIERAQRLYQLEAEHRRITNGTRSQSIPGLVTANAKMERTVEKALQFARTDSTTLILGESGTGKEVVARGIHEISRRRGESFIALNCAAIPDQLLESELFGHEKGAFTGAVKQTLGKVELADGGTLFLDEIGDLSLPLQAKLLRFLQEKIIERVGGRTPIAVDVRFVSATNKNLEELINEGQFREDLYYRLSECSINIPPLRDRPEDTIVIAHHYLERIAPEHDKHVTGFTSDALAAMSSHQWPGNVRELQNRIKRAVITTKGPKITPYDMELSAERNAAGLRTLKEARHQAELECINSALTIANGNISKAAKMLDISRPKLYDLMRTHNLRSDN